ncbi:MAG: hypothetical protein JKY33_04485 [Bacteroidia bacterium]|nr:hypothetical protein [Bacteroidia bacterium]
MRVNWDSVITGLILGIIVPMIIMYCIYLYNYGYLEMIRFVELMISLRIHAPLTSLCVIGNLAIFFLFIKLDFYKSAKGVLMATFLYAGMVLFLKFII